MLGRKGRWGLVLVATLALLPACGGDDDGQAAGAADTTTTTTFDPRVDDADSEDGRWSSGSAILRLDGREWIFELDFCATQPVDASPDTNTVTLQIDGVASGEPATTLRVVETATHEPARRIQVVSVSFEHPDGALLRSWEAQRVVDPETGEVDDMHGEGTTPLLVVRAGAELSVTATDATFWQFDMAGAEDEGVVGTGDLEVTCV